MLLIYSRVSSTEQAGEGKTSLSDQERIGRGFAMTKSFGQFDVACYCDAGVSATIPLSQRPAGGRMLSEAKKGDTIFASKLDRMFRSASDALNMSQIFLEKGIHLVLFDLGSDPISSSGISQFFLTVISAVAQLERTMIRERLSGGKKAKKAKGGHIGGVAPYGYRVIGHGRAATLEPIEAEQKVLAVVRERTDMGIREMTRLINGEGLRSRNGREFMPMQVSRIMQWVKEAT